LRRKILRLFLSPLLRNKPGTDLPPSLFKLRRTEEIRASVMREIRASVMSQIRTSVMSQTRTSESE